MGPGRAPVGETREAAGGTQVRKCGKRKAKGYYARPSALADGIAQLSISVIPPHRTNAFPPPQIPQHQRPSVQETASSLAIPAAPLPSSPVARRAPAHSSQRRRTPPRCNRRSGGHLPPPSPHTTFDGDADTATGRVPRISALSRTSLATAHAPLCRADRNHTAPKGPPRYGHPSNIHCV